jgi:hypothetical protein
MTLDPLVLFEYDHRPGSYCLMMSDSDMGPADDVFEECGQNSNGYGWEGVARSALRVRAPELVDRVSFDSEAGTFVAHAEDPEVLRSLGALLQRAWQDESLLRQFIEAGDPEWFD